VHLNQLLEVDDAGGYINASPIADASPTTPDYIVTQVGWAPTSPTAQSRRRRS